MDCPTLTITVRPYSDTYIARCNGKTASCTSGPEHAACAVAMKVWRALGVDQELNLTRVDLLDLGGKALFQATLKPNQ